MLLQNLYCPYQIKDVSNNTFRVVILQKQKDTAQLEVQTTNIHR